MATGQSKRRDAAARPLAVLIIEDSEDDTALLVRELKRGGYDLTTRRVETLQELDAALDEQAWDLVLADYSLPHLNAPAALARFHQRALDMPVIIVSGSIGEETAVAAMKAGAQDYLMKASLARLLPVIERELRDAEDRRRSRRAEKLSSRLGRILDDAPVEIYICDASTLRFMQVNRTAQRHLGHSVGELAGMRLTAVAPELDEARLAPVLDRLRRGELHESLIETSFRRRDGSHYPVEVRLELSRSETPPVVVAVVQDITDRRQAEQEREQLAREQAARVDAEAAERRAAFLASAGTLLSSSLDYRTTLVSVARLAVPMLADWCAIETIEEGGAIERMPLVHRDPDKAELARRLEEALPPVLAMLPETEATSRRVPVLTAADLERAGAAPAQRALLDALAPVSAMFVPLAIRGRLLGGITFVAAESGRRYEPSDLELAEELARRAAVALENARLYRIAQDADRRKDHFLAMLGHELRNPLGAITSAIAVLDAAGARDQPHAIIGRQARHLTRLVDDMLDVSRISSGKITLRHEPVDLNEIAQRSLESLRATIEAREHETTLRLAAEPVVVEGDAVRLEQVACNLLDNAAKYTPRGGRIDIVVERDGDDALLKVRDSGVGIPAETLPTIFELFTQVPGSLDRAQGGLGLGLALVRGLMERQGGSVTAHSAGVDCGSEFVVRLPVAAGATAPAATQEDLHPPRALDVLLVEDNADGREALRALLEAWGHRVQVAEDGARGIELANASRPEVALIDIGLPDVDGYQVARALRDEPTPIFLVALTGYGQPEDRQRALQAGFDAHLVKPLDPDVLIRLLAEVAAGQERSAASR
jgi:PAS domain S-box-containing protein